MKNVNYLVHELSNEVLKALQGDCCGRVQRGRRVAGKSKRSVRANARVRKATQREVALILISVVTL
jgi:hypothetical protein